MSSAGQVLVVCTGNVCRSPYIERRLRHELAGTGIEVTSAGTRALVGHDMDPGTRELLQRSGADVDGFTRPAADGRPRAPSADLVVAAAREHRAAAARLHPAAMGRTFTLRDLADLLSGVTADDLAASADEPTVGAAGGRRRHRDAVGWCPPDRRASTSPTRSGGRRAGSRRWRPRSTLRCRRSCRPCAVRRAPLSG